MSYYSQHYSCEYFAVFFAVDFYVFKIYLIICVSLCVYVLCPQRLEKDVAFPGAGVTGHREWQEAGNKVPVLWKNRKWVISPDPGFLF